MLIIELKLYNCSKLSLSRVCLALKGFNGEFLMTPVLKWKSKSHLKYNRNMSFPGRLTYAQSGLSVKKLLSKDISDLKKILETLRDHIYTFITMGVFFV